MLTELLLAEPKKAFKLRFSSNLVCDLISKEKLNLLINSEEPNERRILHSVKWCFQHQRNHEYFQIIFREDSQQYEPVQRDYFFALNGDSLIVDITPEHSYISAFQGGPFVSSFLESMTDSVLVTEAEPSDLIGHKVLDCNPAFTHMTGFSRQDVIGKSPRILQGPDTLEQDRAVIREKLNKWQNVKHTLLNYKKDGTTFYVELNITPVKDVTGWYSHWISVQSDITAENEKNRLYRQRALISEASGIGVWVYDIDQNTLDWDARMQEIYDVEPSDKRFYQHWVDSVHPEDQERAGREVELAVNTNGIFDTEFRIVTPKGAVKYIRSRANISLDPISKTRKMMGVNWDVTKERIDEQELEKQRSLAVANSKLASLGELAAGVGHEINNPLSIITMTNDLFRILLQSDSVGKSELEKGIDEIERAARRIEKIVQGLRNVSRSQSEAGEFVSIELGKDISETISMFTVLYGKQGIEIRYAKPEEPVWILGDHSIVQQILVNLLTNAKDAIENVEGGQIDLVISQQEEYVNLSVKDNGVGIDDAIKYRLFEPFTTTKELGLGTGLGLSITKSLVEKMSGKISFESKPGSGTVFNVQFASSNKETDLPIPVARHEEEGVYVLLIDDDEDVASAIESGLKRLKCNVKIFGRAEEAIEFIEEGNNFQLLISDLRMPDIDGLSLARSLDQMGLASSAFKVLMTGDVTSLNTSSKEYRWFDQVIQKPIRMDKLRNLIDLVTG